MQEDENTVFSERFLNTLCTRGRTRSETKPTKKPQHRDITFCDNYRRSLSAMSEKIMTLYLM